MDNKSLKDGVGDLFTLRMRDRSLGGDGSVVQTLLLSTGYPVDYGTGGCYQHCAKGGALPANLAAASPIYSFQWPVSLLALLRRVRIQAWTGATGFAAGLATFDMFIARGFTVPDLGGAVANLSGGGGRLRGIMSASQARITVATTAAITPGTRTLDPDTVNSITVTAPVTANTPFSTTPLTIFEKLGDAHPFFMAGSEGFVIRASVPGTGVWTFTITSEWDEVTLF